MSKAKSRVDRAKALADLVIRDGKTLAEAGELHGLSDERVRQILVEDGYDLRENRKRHTAACEQQKQQLIETAILLRSWGTRWRLIAEELGVDANRLRMLAYHYSRRNDLAWPIKKVDT